MPEPKKNPKTETWEFVFDYYVKGVRKQVRRRGFQTRKEANKAMIALQNEVLEEKFVCTDKTTVGAFVQNWIDTVRKLEIDETTMYNNKLYLKNHIMPRIGKLRLQKLDHIVCQEFVNEMHEKGYARNTIDRVVTMLKKALDKAVQYKLIRENYMRQVTLPRVVKKAKEIWTAKQAIQFLKATEDKRFHCVYALALLTGMRQGEILGLRWRDIDFERRIISINQTLTHYGKTIKSGAKTAAGIRTIAMPNLLITILKKQYEKYDELKQKLGEKFIDMDLVIFNLSNGKTVFPSNLTKIYTADVKRAGLPHITFHSMRHTHATMLIEQNVNVKLISERLGHSKIGVTLDTYSHVIPSMQQEVADKIDEIMVM